MVAALLRKSCGLGLSDGACGCLGCQLTSNGTVGGLSGDRGDLLLVGDLAEELREPLRQGTWRCPSCVVIDVAICAGPSVAPTLNAFVFSDPTADIVADLAKLGLWRPRPLAPATKLFRCLTIHSDFGASPFLLPVFDVFLLGNVSRSLTMPLGDCEDLLSPPVLVEDILLGGLDAPLPTRCSKSADNEARMSRISSRTSPRNLCAITVNLLVKISSKAALSSSESAPGPSSSVTAPGKFPVDISHMRAPVQRISPWRRLS
mmetsp:Transcript_56379/g.132204  ORF Transcript_56379/g.132204 Transcript_56379/m.132204 type:complete len:261 (-) Transcript_56379:26-808(-)